MKVNIIYNIIDWEIDDNSIKDRINLTDQITFAINIFNSNDINNALSILEVPNENTERNCKLYEINFHIADASFFITKDSIIDKEALNRAATIDLVFKYLPMIPRLISEDKCSLNPGVQRLALTLTFRLFENGDLDLSFEPIYNQSVRYKIIFRLLIAILLLTMNLSTF